VYNLNIIFETQNSDDGYKSVFKGYAEYCLQNYTNINFNLINSRDIKPSCDVRDKYGAFSLVIENPKTKKFFLVSYWDKIVDMYNSLAYTGELDNCIEFFSSSGGHTDCLNCKPTEYKYTPISYTVTKDYSVPLIDELYSSNIKREIKERLEFRGCLYELRLHLSKDSRFKVTKDFIPVKDYIRELNNNLINLSINGAGEICMRDIEILGLGTALLRTKLVTKFHNELIPDFHYISVDYDDLNKQNKEQYHKELSDRIITKFNTVKKDLDFIKFISENGRKWYVENGTIKSNIDILTKTINLHKLIDV
jgi:hypothetical protein